jgi:transmembrane sensor
MTEKTVEFRIDKKILEEAASHYLSLQDDTMSGAELKAWQAWFMRSKDHQTAFRRLETLWGALDSVSLDDLTTSAVAAERAAPFLADGSVISLVARDAAPTAEAARSPRWYALIAASFAAVVMAGYMAFSPFDGPASNPATPYYTAAGQQRVVHLADGSIVELGSDSAVSVAYTADERGLTLVRGQAIFTVAKNPNRPFVVRAGSGSVTAIGTVFNVRRTVGDIQVRVLEGTVAVRPKGVDAVSIDSEKSVKEVALVTAGNQTGYSQDGVMTAVEAADVHADLGWRVGVLTLVNRELSDVIQELNRYLETEVAIGDNAIGKFRFTGTVYPDKIDEWLEGLTEGYPLKVMRVGGRTILMLDDAPSN